MMHEHEDEDVRYTPLACTHNRTEFNCITRYTEWLSEWVSESEALTCVKRARHLLLSFNLFYFFSFTILYSTLFLSPLSTLPRHLRCTVWVRIHPLSLSFSVPRLPLNFNLDNDNLPPPVTHWWWSLAHSLGPSVLTLPVKAWVVKRQREKRGKKVKQGHWSKREGERESVCFSPCDWSLWRLELTRWLSRQWIQQQIPLDHSCIHPVCMCVCVCPTLIFCFDCRTLLSICRFSFSLSLSVHVFCSLSFFRSLFHLSLFVPLVLGWICHGEAKKTLD